jgi:hypothetical protein
MSSGGAFSGVTYTQAHLLWTDAGGTDQILQFDSVLEEDWDQGATITEHPVEDGPDVADHIKPLLPKCSLKIKSTNEPIKVSAYPNIVASISDLELDLVSVLLPPPPQLLTYENWYNPITLRALLATAGGVVGGAIGGAAGGSGAAGLAGGAVGSGLAGLAAALLLAAKKVPVVQPIQTGLPSKLFAPITATTQQWPDPTDFVEAMQWLLVFLKNNATIFTLVGSKQTESTMAIEVLAFHRSGETGTGQDITIGLKKLNVVTTQTVAAPILNLPGGGGKPPTAQGPQTPTPSAPARAGVAVKLLNKIFGSGPTPPAVP